LHNKVFNEWYLALRSSEWNSLADKQPNLRYGDKTVVAGFSNALGSV
jgi:hypothetical protein